MLPAAAGLSLLVAPAQYAQAQSEDIQFEGEFALPSCISLMSFRVVNCAAQAFYYVLWQPTHWLSSKAASFMDFFIFYSINSATYSGVPIEIEDTNEFTSFVDEGWKVVRDISNILFIFGLLYVAIALVLRVNIGNANPKKILIYVILMAILINFSLFFSRIIVDAGNILARTLYNQISLVNRGTQTQDLSNDEGIKSVGLMFKALTNPQRLIAPGAPQDTTITIGNTSEIDGTFFLLVGIIATILNIILIFTFITVGIYFVTRILGLYISMIFSPFAFASLAIPKGASINQIGFYSWFQNLLSYSFMAPLFIFFLYLTIRFMALGIPINPSILGGASLSGQFMGIIIPGALPIGFILLGKQQVKKLSGELGKMGAQLVTKTIGAAAMVASGGAALAGGAVIGGAGKALASSGRVKKLANTGKIKLFGKERNLGAVGRGIGKSAAFGGARAARTNFDPRSNKMAQRAGRVISAGAALGGAGSEINSIKLGAAGTSTYDSYLKGRTERKRAQLERREQALQMSGLDAKRYDEQAKKRNSNLKAEEVQRYEAAKAQAEKAYTETEAYKNATAISKERMLTAMRQEFDAKYKEGKVVTGYTQKGKIDDSKTISQRDDRIAQETSAAALDAKVQNLLKERRFADLENKIKQSTTYINATQANKDMFLAEAKKEFDAAYAQDDVLTEFDEGSGIITVSARNSKDVASNYLQDATWEQNERDRIRTEAPASITKEYEDDARYKRMQTSAELNRQVSKEFGITQRDKKIKGILRSDGRATEEYGRDTVKRTSTDALSAQQIQKLTNNLNNLNDTLGSYLHLYENPTAFNAMSVDELLIQAAALDHDQRQKALLAVANRDPREAAAALEQIAAKMSGEIAVLESRMRSETNATLISEMARKKQLLENKRRQVVGGFDQQAKLAQNISNARGK